MVRIGIAMLLIPFLVNAQDEKGIHFEQNLTWQQVQAKAKKEGKFIFVDCFATWCGPCKAMDKNIYTDDNVGQFMNQHFISVKVQMDTSKTDDELVRSRYADAHVISLRGSVKAYPSFLFYSPEGRLVHKEVGYKELNNFMTLAKNSMSPDKQYFTLLSEYQRGKEEYVTMPYLAMQAKSIGDPELCLTIGQHFVTHYLIKLQDKDLFTKSNLILLYEFVQTSTAPGFQLFMTQRERIDTILWKNAAERKVIDIARDEEIKPFLAAGVIIADSVWTGVEKKMIAKYGDLGQIGYWEGRLTYVWEKSDWNNLAKFYVLYFENRDSINVFDVNNFSWEVFIHCNDTAVLNVAIKVFNRYKEEDLVTRDTYANLLYKLGRVKEAIEWEKKTVELEGVNATRAKRAPDLVYEQTLIKMQHGEPTW